MFTVSHTPRTIGFLLVLVLALPFQLIGQASFNWTTPESIGASETVTITVVYDGTSYASGVDLWLRLGPLNTPPVLDVVGNEINRIRNGNSQTLSVTLDQNRYAIPDQDDLLDGDVFEMDVTPHCPMPYADAVGTIDVQGAVELAINGILQQDIENDNPLEWPLDVFGPKVKIGTNGGVNLSVGDPDPGIELELYDEEQDFEVNTVPGNALILKYSFPVGSQNITVTGLRYDGETQSAVNGAFVIPVSSDLFGAIMDPGQAPPVVELLVDLSAHCGITTSFSKSGTVTIGWNSTGNATDPYCDSQTRNVLVTVTPVDRGILLDLATWDHDSNPQSAREPWSIADALDPCYAGLNENLQYFRVPYLIQNTGDEAIKIRRFDLRRIWIQTFGDVGGLDETIGVTNVAVDALHPVTVLGPFPTGEEPSGDIVSFVEAQSEETDAIHVFPTSTNLVLTCPDWDTAIEIGVGEEIEIHVWMKVNYDVDDYVPTEQLACGEDKPALLNNYLYRVDYDWDCERMESFLGTNLALCPEYFLGTGLTTTTCLGDADHYEQWSPVAGSDDCAIASHDPIHYIGLSHNVTTACFLGDDAWQVGGTVDCPQEDDPEFVPFDLPNGWDVRFLITSEKINLWPATGSDGSEILALEVVLDRYLYVNEAELLDDLPIRVRLTNDEVYSTNPNVGEGEKLLRLIGPGPGEPFCDPLDCPVADGVGGWVQSMRFLLAFEDFPLEVVDQSYDFEDPLNWYSAFGNGHRTITKLANAVVSIPIRMHCPPDAGKPDCDCEYPSGQGCEFSPDLMNIDNIAPSGPRNLKLSLVQIPNSACPAPCDLRPISLACASKRFYVRCPGCRRVGIHNNTYSIERWNYGTPDMNGDHVSDVAYEERTRQDLIDDPQPGDELLRRDLAMAGDMIWTELQTSIESTVPDYGPYETENNFTVPGVDLHHLYFTTKFGFGTDEAASTRTVAVKGINGQTVEANDARTHIVHVGDQLTFTWNNGTHTSHRIVAVSGSQLVVTPQFPYSGQPATDVWTHVPISSSITTPIEAELEFISAPPSPGVDGEIMQRLVIDLTHPALLPGGSEQVVYYDWEDEVWMFDLSPGRMLDLSAMDPPPLTMSYQDGFEYRDTDFDFMAPENDDIRVNIRMKWQISVNIGPTVVPVNVDPHAYLTMRPYLETDLFLEDPLWSEPSNVVQFNDPGFCDALFADPHPTTCDDLMYFCTKAGASFNLMGYEMTNWDHVGKSDEPCDYGPTMTVKLKVGDQNYENDAFPHEFRNWFVMTNASSAFDAQSSNATWTLQHSAWAAHDVSIQEAYGPSPDVANFPERPQTYAFNATPQSPPGFDLHNELAMGVPTEGNGMETNINPPTGSTLALSDDGFAAFLVKFRYQADQSTADGPFYPHNPPDHYYKHKSTVHFRMDAGGRLPCPYGTLRTGDECVWNAVPMVRYVKPVPVVQGTYLASDQQLDMFDGVELKLRRIETAPWTSQNPCLSSGPLPHVWVDFCERLSSGEGLEVNALFTGPTSNLVNVPEVGSDVYQIVEDPEEGFAATDIALLHVQVEAPCANPVVTPHFDVEENLVENRAEILLRANWSCANVAPVITCPGDEDLDDLPDYPTTAWFQLDPVERLLEITSVDVQAEGCGYHVRAEIHNNGEGAVPDGRIGFALSNTDWSYDAGSATLTLLEDPNDLEGVTMEVGASGLVDLQEDQSVWADCNNAQSVIHWNLGDNTICTLGCDDPSTPLLDLFDPGIGLRPDEVLVFEFDISHSDPLSCDPQGTTFLNIYADDGSYCVFPCAHTEAPGVEILPLPGVAVPELSLEVVGNCVQELTVTIDPADITSFPRVFVVDIPDGLFVDEESIASQCGSQSLAVVLPSGDVQWTVGASNDPCSLTLQVAYEDPQDEAAYVITAGVQAGCCSGVITFQCGTSPCDLSFDVSSTSSYCSGTINADCVVRPTNLSNGLLYPFNEGTTDQFPAIEIDFDGATHVFRFQINQGMVVQDPGESTIIIGVLDEYINGQQQPGEWWLQLYLDEGAPYNAGYDIVEGDYGDPEQWSFHRIADSPISSIGKPGTVFYIEPSDPGAADQWVQFGSGANTHNANNGFFGTIGINVGGVVQWQDLALEVDCDWAVFNTECSGTVTVTPDPGTYPCTVSLMDGNVPLFPPVDLTSGSHEFDPVCPGDWSVVVTQGDCEDGQAVSVGGNPEPLDHTFSYSELVCPGGTGNATITVFGGSGEYDIEWHSTTGSTTTIENATAGNPVSITDLPPEEECWVVVVDGYCSFTVKFYISVDPNGEGPFIDDYTVNNPCNGPNGSITLGELPPGSFTFTWTDANNHDLGQGTSISHLGSGVYTLVVEDATGCTTEMDFELQELEASAVITPITCADACDAVVVITASGGAPGYTYQWTPTPPNGQGTNTISGLCAGQTYSCLVKDTNPSGACSVTVQVTIPTAPSFTASITAQTDVACMGANSGSATVTATGGVSPYTYSWTGPNGFTATTAQINDLGAGTYTCTVRDALGCQRFPQVTITEPSEAFTASISSQTNVLCHGANTGRATVAASHGVQPITFSWNTNPVQTTANIQNLFAGSYACTVTDGNGCVVVVNVTITQPGSMPSAVIASQTNVACHGGLTGGATISVTGGTPPYDYQWSPDLSSTASLTNVGAGTYHFIVDDANNCKSNLIEVVITQPSDLQANVSPTNGSCPTYCSGSAAATVSGGTSGYTYSWGPAPGSGQGTLSASAMCPATYTFTVTDANGCQETANATITNNCAGPVIVNCGNLNDLPRATGTLSVASVSGASYYQFNFSTPCGYGRNITTSVGGTSVPLSFVTVPLEDCQRYTVKARAFMTATQQFGDWGPDCMLTLSGCAAPMQLKPAFVWPSNLVNHSTGFVEVNKRNDAYRYQFEFYAVDANDNPVGSPVKTINPVAQGQAGAVYQCNRANLNSTPLLSPCTKYKVRVRRSLDCTTNWENTWGPYVLIKTTGTCGAGLAVQPSSFNEVATMQNRLDAVIFPNPNDGSVLHIQLMGFEELPAEADIVLFDVMGRAIHQKDFLVEADPQLVTLAFDRVLASGAYVVKINTPAGEMRRNLVIER